MEVEGGWPRSRRTEFFLLKAEPGREPGRAGRDRPTEGNTVPNLERASASDQGQRGPGVHPGIDLLIA